MLGIQEIMDFGGLQYFKIKFESAGKWAYGDHRAEMDAELRKFREDYLERILMRDF